VDLIAASVAHVAEALMVVASARMEVLTAEVLIVEVLMVTAVVAEWADTVNS
jgi:hypothetical protein